METWLSLFFFLRMEGDFDMRKGIVFDQMVGYCAGVAAMKFVDHHLTVISCTGIVAQIGCKAISLCVGLDVVERVSKKTKELREDLFKSLETWAES